MGVFCLTVLDQSVTPETIAARMEEKNAEETSVQP